MGRKKRPIEKRGQPRIGPAFDRLFRDINQKTLVPEGVREARRSIMQQYRAGGLELAEQQFEIIMATLPLIKEMSNLSEGEIAGINSNLVSFMEKLRDRDFKRSAN